MTTIRKYESRMEGDRWWPIQLSSTVDGRLVRWMEENESEYASVVMKDGWTFEVRLVGTTHGGEGVRGVWGSGISEDIPAEPTYREIGARRKAIRDKQDAEWTERAVKALDDALAGGPDAWHVRDWRQEMSDEGLFDDDGNEIVWNAESRVWEALDSYAKGATRRSDLKFPQVIASTDGQTIFLTEDPK